MPKQVAQPKPPPAPSKAKPNPGKVFSTKEQEAFNAEADALAASLGWQGGDELVLNDIQVCDARNYLRAKFHEVHQSALTPEKDTPEAAAICEHLGITDADEVKLVSDAIQAAYDREVASAPSNPTSLPGEHRVGAMSANLEVSASSALDRFSKAGK